MAHASRSRLNCAKNEEEDEEDDDKKDEDGDGDVSQTEIISSVTSRPSPLLSCYLGVISKERWNRRTD